MPKERTNLQIRTNFHSDRALTENNLAANVINSDLWIYIQLDTNK